MKPIWTGGWAVVYAIGKVQHLLLNFNKRHSIKIAWHEPEVKKKPAVKQPKLSNESQEAHDELWTHFLPKLRRITKNKIKITPPKREKKSLLFVFLGVSASICAASCKWQDLTWALSKLAFSPNLGTSTCCLVAGLQMHRNEQKFNLLWLWMVQRRCRGKWEMKRLVSSYTSCLKSWSTGLLRTGTVLSQKPRHQLALPPFVGFPPGIAILMISLSHQHCTASYKTVSMQ